MIAFVDFYQWRRLIKKKEIFAFFKLLDQCDGAKRCPQFLKLILHLFLYFAVQQGNVKSFAGKKSKNCIESWKVDCLEGSSDTTSDSSALLVLIASQSSGGYDVSPWCMLLGYFGLV